MVPVPCFPPLGKRVEVPLGKRDLLGVGQQAGRWALPLHLARQGVEEPLARA